MSLTVSGERSARGRWVGVLTLVTALLGLQLALGTGSSPAFAHAELLETTPEDGAVLDTAPDTVELRFNKPVQVVEDAMRLPPRRRHPRYRFWNQQHHRHHRLSGRFCRRCVCARIPGRIRRRAPDRWCALIPDRRRRVHRPRCKCYACQSRRYRDDRLRTYGHTVSRAARPRRTRVSLNRFVTRAPGPAGPGIRKLGHIAYGTALAASLLLIPASGARVTGNEFITYLPETGDLVILPASTWSPGVSWQLLASRLPGAGVRSRCAASRRTFTHGRNRCRGSRLRYGRALRAVAGRTYADRATRMGDARQQTSGT